MLEVEIAIDLAALEPAQASIEAYLAACGAPSAQQLRVRLVVEELIANLVMHGRFLADPPPPARVSVRREDALVTLCVEDAAAPYDPRGVGPVMPPQSIESMTMGGAGLTLLRRVAEIRGYMRTAAGWNRSELRVG